MDKGERGHCHEQEHEFLVPIAELQVQSIRLS
jgi:hypothetical protein